MLVFGMIWPDAQNEGIFGSEARTFGPSLRQKISSGCYEVGNWV
jgi:hypothetical protein